MDKDMEMPALISLQLFFRLYLEMVIGKMLDFFMFTSLNILVNGEGRAQDLRETLCF